MQILLLYPEKLVKEGLIDSDSFCFAELYITQLDFEFVTNTFPPLSTFISWKYHRDRHEELRLHGFLSLVIKSPLDICQESLWFDNLVLQYSVHHLQIQKYQSSSLLLTQVFKMWFSWWHGLRCQQQKDILITDQIRVQLVWQIRKMFTVHSSILLLLNLQKRKSLSHWFCWCNRLRYQRRKELLILYQNACGSLNSQSSSPGLTLFPAYPVLSNVLIFPLDICNCMIATVGKLGFWCISIDDYIVWSLCWALNLFQCVLSSITTILCNYNQIHGISTDNLNLDQAVIQGVNDKQFINVNCGNWSKTGYICRDYHRLRTLDLRL